MSLIIHNLCVRDSIRNIGFYDAQIALIDGIHTTGR